MVFIDKFSKNNLESQKVDVREIFRLAGEKFQKQFINLGYDSTNIPITHLAAKHKRKKWYDEILGYLFPELNLYVKIRSILDTAEEVREQTRKELAENTHDLVIYFVSNMAVGTGVAIADGIIDLERPVRNANGRGLIILGTDLSSGFKKDEYLSKYSETLMHEQCHLYGLFHVPIPGTLMFPYSAYGSEQLDEFSKPLLLEALEAEKNQINPPH